MGQILVHAGNPKTGSTSIQRWLRRHLEQLREQYGISILQETGAMWSWPVHLDVFQTGLVVVANSFPSLYGTLLERGAAVGERVELMNESSIA